MIVTVRFAKVFDCPMVKVALVDGKVTVTLLKVLPPPLNAATAEGVTTIVLEAALTVSPPPFEPQLVTFTVLAPRVRLQVLPAPLQFIDDAVTVFPFVSREPFVKTS